MTRTGDVGELSVWSKLKKVFDVFHREQITFLTSDQKSREFQCARSIIQDGFGILRAPLDAHEKRVPMPSPTSIVTQS